MEKRYIQEIFLNSKFDGFGIFTIKKGIKNLKDIGKMEKKTVDVKNIIKTVILF